MEKRVSIGLVGLTALAIAGNFIIALPLSSDDGSDVLGLLLAIGASFLLFGLGYPLLSRFFNIKPGGLRGAVRYLYLAVLVVFMGIIALIGIDTLTSFAEFTADVVLPSLSVGLILTAIFLTALFIASKNIGALSKMGTVLFLICLAFSLIIFLLSLGDMSLKYLLPKNGVDLTNVLYESGEVFFSAFSEAFILVSALSVYLGDKKSATIGNAAGAVIIILCCLNTILVFGGGFAGSIEYPYVAAVRAVGSGDVFSGTEGFLYVSVFFCSILKCALSFFGIKGIAQKIYQLKNKNK